MNQPHNKIKCVPWRRTYKVTLTDFGGGALLSIGRTKLPALKATKRRLERLTRDVERMIDKEQG